MRRAGRKTVTDEIRTAIQKSHLSRYEIAKRSGVTEGSLSRFMNRKTSLSLESIEKLAPVLGLQVLVKRKR